MAIGRMKFVKSHAVKLHSVSPPSCMLFSKEILTEAPENDRFHWRKYGEKNILYAEYPRYVSLMELHNASPTYSS